MNLNKLNEYIKTNSYTVMVIDGSEIYELTKWDKEKQLFETNNDPDWTLRESELINDNIRVFSEINNWEDLN